MKWRLLAGFSVLISLLFSSVAQASNILVIQSYHKSFSWDRLYVQGLREELGPENKLHFFQMNTKRLPASAYQKRADLAWKKYEKLKPDYVVLGDDNALKFLGERFAATETPVVFLGINGNPHIYFKDKKVPENMTGVLERPLVIENMKRLKKVMPDIKRVLIMFDSGHTSKAAIGEFTRQINSEEMKDVGIKFEFKFLGKEKDWKSAVKNAKQEGYGAIFLGSFHTIRRENGAHVSSRKILSWTFKNSEAPVFAFWTTAVGGKKAIGGVLLDGYDQGRIAAELIEEIRSGTIPKLKDVTQGKIVYSRTALKRWDIKLPLDLEKEATFVD